MKLIAQAGTIGIKAPPLGINPGSLGSDYLTIIIRNAVTIIFTIGAILLLFMLLWGGIDYLMSAGDKEKSSNARKKITSALIGFIVLTLTYLIIRVVGGIFGFDIINQPINIPALNAL